MIQNRGWVPDNPEFRAYYGWQDAWGPWLWEGVETRSGSVAVHRFPGPRAAEPRGTLFLLHGYLEHTGLRVPLAQAAAAAGWTVCGMDMPGHGLSEGERGHIGDFSQYSEAFSRTLQSYPWPKPWRAIGHSTGAAILLLNALERGNPFELCVLEAPLVRTFLWTPTVVLKGLLKGAVTTLPRRNAGLPKTQAFYRQLIQDPLYVPTVPVAWFDALERYEQGTASWPSIDGAFLIFQGTADTVVDGDYNLRYLRRKLRGAEIIPIRGGRHHLFRDEGPAGASARDLLYRRW